MNQLENKLNLAQKIQLLKELINELSEFSKSEDHVYAEAFSQFLIIMTNMFDNVDQRLKDLEKKPTN